ncbi:MAG: DUF1178 family protein [Kiloniellaceae bacterium]
MIVYDLRCRKGHVFEAWFRASAAYEEQAEAGTVACPTCGSRTVEKAPMAPRLATGDSRDKAETAAETAQAGKVMRAMRELRRKVEENFDYVGGEFAEEARRIHYGETDPHSIYGETSDEEAAALHDEGVPFGRIPWPARQDS